MDINIPESLIEAYNEAVASMDDLPDGEYFGNLTNIEMKDFFVVSSGRKTGIILELTYNFNGSLYKDTKFFTTPKSIAFFKRILTTLGINASTFKDIPEKLHLGIGKSISVNKITQGNYYQTYINGADPSTVVEEDVPF